MSEAIQSYGVLGAGNVARALIGMLVKPSVAEWAGLEQVPRVVAGRDGWHEGSRSGKLVEADLQVLPDVDVLFCAWPSTPDDEPTLTLSRQQLALGRFLMTATKGPWARHYDELKAAGHWATVGGGTKLLPSLALHTQDFDNIREIHLSTNATLTYGSSEVAAGNNQTEVMTAAKGLGYAEPGTGSAYDIIYGEAAGDVPLKTAIVWSTIFPHLQRLMPDLLKTSLTRQDVLKALNKADDYRYLVSMFHESEADIAHSRSEGRIGGFEVPFEGMLVLAGFMNVNCTNPLRHFRNISGPKAGFYIGLGPEDNSSFDGETMLWGTGAGGAATATAMLDNLRYDRARRK